MKMCMKISTILAMGMHTRISTVMTMGTHIRISTIMAMGTLMKTSSIMAMDICMMTSIMVTAMHQDTMATHMKTFIMSLTPCTVDIHMKEMDTKVTLMTMDTAMLMNMDKALKALRILRF